MRTVAVTFIVTETGDVKQMTWVDESDSRIQQEISLYGAPYLGSFENSEDWRRALGAYATQTLHDNGYTGCHGERLTYVSKGCHVYVYEVDFDSQRA